MIDILIPTYEPNPDHLRAAIKSVLDQTCTDWLLLVHDDASTMDVRSIVHEFIQHPNVCFKGSFQRQGIGGNWNASLANARRPYVQFLFQDDIWQPTYLQESVDVLERHPSVGFVASDHEYDCVESVANAYLYQEVRNFRNENIANGIHDHEEFLKYWITHELHPNMVGEPSFVMMRNELTKSVGKFAEDLPQFLDVEYWLRCLMKSDWFYRKENLGSFRVHPGGASAQNQESGAGIYDRLECFERVIRLAPTWDIKRSARKARKTALVTMARKFLKRRKEGKNTPIASSGKFKKFALRHPVLMGSALMKALLTPSAS